MESKQRRKKQTSSIGNKAPQKSPRYNKIRSELGIDSANDFIEKKSFRG